MLRSRLPHASDGGSISEPISGRAASRVATLWKRYANAAMTISSASGRS
jgi:hypothetical protein